jgi:hypothetical protein
MDLTQKRHARGIQIVMRQSTQIADVRAIELGRLFLNEQKIQLRMMFKHTQAETTTATTPKMTFHIMMTPLGHKTLMKMMKMMKTITKKAQVKPELP